MQIEFVNHSSIIIRDGGVSLMCDFWKDGSIFDNSWDLLCETKFDYDDFSKITHLWFSHEHPDHFSPPNLSSIPVSIRRNITILFQKTVDKRLISFCDKLEFSNIVELDPFVPHDITEDFQVTCAPYGADWADVDSWLHVRTPTATVLNINDCELESDHRTQKIQQYCGDIDVLATQFSFASKQGDDSDTDWIHRTRKYHLKKLDLKLNAFKARYAIPFASFVYWSHQENRYLNQGAIPLQDAVNRIEENNSKPIVMYPDDKWKVNSEWDNSRPIELYAARYQWLESLSDSDFRASHLVNQEDLIKRADQFLAKMKAAASEPQIIQYIAQKHSFIRNEKINSRLISRLKATVAGLAGRYESCLIYVEDHAQAYEFTIQRGLMPISKRFDECHIRIKSQALDFGFSVGFGGETLQINGRFQRIQPDGWLYLSEIFFLARRLEQKLVLPKYVVLDSLARSFGLTRRTA